MKIDIARQPLVPAFLTLFVLAVAAMCGAAGHASPGAGNIHETMPLLGGLIAKFQTTYPVWARIIGGFIILFAGMCTGRIAIRYNLYTVNSCMPIPLYAITACGIFIGNDYLIGFTASMLLALATKNYCIAFRNGYGFDPIFRASFYLGLLPLVYAPATPLVLILPFAVLLFRRTLREVVVATMGLLIPILTACYISWGFGNEFIAPAIALGKAVVAGTPLLLFHSVPVFALAMLGCILILSFTAFVFFLTNIYAVGTKPRLILIFIIGIFVLTLALLFSPAATPEAFTLLAIPAAILMPVFFVRIHRGVVVPIYVLLLAVAIIRASYNNIF